MISAAEAGHREGVVRLNEKEFCPAFDKRFQREISELSRLYDVARNNCIYTIMKDEFSEQVREGTLKKAKVLFAKIVELES